LKFAANFLQHKNFQYLRLKNYLADCCHDDDDDEKWNGIE
jgi:hypothetical protein